MQTNLCRGLCKASEDPPSPFGDNPDDRGDMPDRAEGEIPEA